MAVISNSNELDKALLRVLASGDKQRFYNLTFNIYLDRRISHLWCEHTAVMKELLFLFEDERPSQIGLMKLRFKMAEDMSICSNCIIQYQAAKAEFCKLLLKHYTKESVEAFMAKLWRQDCERIRKLLLKVNVHHINDQSSLVLILFEILNYPQVLDDAELNQQFAELLVQLDEAETDLELSANEKPAGVYMLLLHPKAEVRFWAKKKADELGPIATKQDFDDLLLVFERCMRVLEKDEFAEDGSEYGAADKRFRYTRTAFWHGFAALLSYMTGDTLNCFVERFPTVVDLVLCHLDGGPSAQRGGHRASEISRSAVRSLNKLLSGMGFRLWLCTSYSPAVVLDTLLAQCGLSTNAAFHHGCFSMVDNLMTSLEPFDSADVLAYAVRVIRFLLDDVARLPAVTPPNRALARRTALALALKRYRHDPPNPPLPCRELLEEAALAVLRTRPSPAEAYDGLAVAEALLAEMVLFDAAAVRQAYIAGIMEAKPTTTTEADDTPDREHDPAEEAVSTCWQQHKWSPRLWEQVFSVYHASAKLHTALFRSAGELAFVHCRDECIRGASLLSTPAATSADLMLQYRRQLGKYLSTTTLPEGFLRGDDIVRTVFALLVSPVDSVQQGIAFQLKGTYGGTSLFEQTIPRMVAEGNNAVAFYSGVDAAVRDMYHYGIDRVFACVQHVLSTLRKLWPLFPRTVLPPLSAVSGNGGGGAVIQRTDGNAAVAALQSSARLFHEILVRSPRLALLSTYPTVMQRLLYILRTMLPPVVAGDRPTGPVFSVAEWARRWLPAMLYAVVTSPRTVTVDYSVLQRWVKCLSASLKVLRATRTELPAEARGHLQSIWSTSRVPLSGDDRQRLKPDIDEVLNLGAGKADQPRHDPGPILSHIIDTDALASVFNVYVDAHIAAPPPPTRTSESGGGDVGVVDQAASTTVDKLFSELDSDAVVAAFKARRQAASAAGRKTKLVRLPSTAEEASRKRRERIQMQHARRELRDERGASITALHKVILAWDYYDMSTWATSAAAGIGPLQPVSDRFASADQYRAVFEPLLLEEFRAALARAKEENEAGVKGARDSRLMSVVSVEGVDEFHILMLKLHGTDGKAASPASPTAGFELAREFKENDMVLVSQQSPAALAARSQSEGQQPLGLYFLGIIEKRDNAAPNHGHGQGHVDLTVLRVKVFFGHRPRPPTALAGGAVWYVTYVMRLSTLHREFHSVHSCHYLHLIGSILDPSRFTVPPAAEPTVVPRPLRKLFERMFNREQLDAVYRAVAPEAVASESASGFVLIQGPPGTGKTTTLMAILAGLRALQKRVLVCAPSNAAADEIAMRLLRQGTWDSDAAAVPPNIVRIGVVDKVHPEVRPLLLDSQLEAAQAKRKDDMNLDSLQQSIEETLRKLEELNNELERALKFDTEGSKLEQLRTRKATLHRQYTDLLATRRARRQALDSGRGELARALIAEADFVVATLSSAGMDILGTALGTADDGFDTVVIDEAAQAVEPATLIPLRYGATRCVMIGDPQQLPATVLSSAAAGMSYATSLFTRLARNGHPVVMLREQYRMHPAIREFPSQWFYGGLLRDAPSVDPAGPFHKPYHDDPAARFGPFVFYDVPGSEEKGRLASLRNQKEALVAATIASRLVQMYPELRPDPVAAGNKPVPKIAIITPYRQQVSEIATALRDPETQQAVEISTIDGFQGREKDVVILSCVRAAESRGIGFVADVRRMNVAITRAKYSLIILGNATALSQNAHWRALIEHAQQRNCYISFTTMGKIFPEHSGNLPLHCPITSEEGVQRNNARAPARPAKRKTILLEGPPSKRPKIADRNAV